jgi:hypothetical protein
MMISRRLQLLEVARRTLWWPVSTVGAPVDETPAT